MGKITLCFLIFAATCFGETNFDAALSKLPGWDGKAQIKEIGGGLTNHNYIVTINGKSYFMRHTVANAVGSDSKREFLATRLAAAASIGPKIELYNESEGIMVTEFIPTKPFTLQDSGMVEKCVATLKKLHQVQDTLPDTFCPYQIIDDYLATCQKLKIALPESIEKVALPAIKEMPRKSVPLVPCHLDLHQGNFIYDGEKLWLIDWEYAAQADPLFDLATFASTEKMSQDEMKTLLALYLPEGDFAHFRKMRILADIRWGLWSYIQAETSTIDYPFKELGDSFFKSAHHLINGGTQIGVF